MENVPVGIDLLFGATTAVTVGLFCRAARSWRTLWLVAGWLLLQCALGLSGFYTNTGTVPPRFLLLVAPPMLVIMMLLLTPFGRAYLDRLNIRLLTLLHTVRTPVEVVLFALFFYRAVPKLMTFEGRNWDILSGLTAPVLFLIVFKTKQVGAKGLLLWNLACLALLVNIVINAALSAPSPLQQFAFEQPNVAIQHFPYVWLPSCVVPLVMLAHVAAIRQVVLSMQRGSTKAAVAVPAEASAAGQYAR